MYCIFDCYRVPSSSWYVIIFNVLFIGMLKCVFEGGGEDLARAAMFHF